MDTLTAVVFKAIFNFLSVVGEERPLLGHHALNLQLGFCCQENFTQLEVKNIVECMVELRHPLFVKVVFNSVRLNGVDCGLNDCPRVLGGEEAVQELGKCH